MHACMYTRSICIIMYTCLSNINRNKFIIFDCKLRNMHIYIDI